MVGGVGWLVRRGWEGCGDEGWEGDSGVYRGELIRFLALFFGLIPSFLCLDQIAIRVIKSMS